MLYQNTFYKGQFEMKYQILRHKDTAKLYREEKPIAVGSNNTRDIAWLYRELAREAMEQAHNMEHMDDFCIPEFTIEEMQKQFEKIIQENT